MLILEVKQRSCTVGGFGQDSTQHCGYKDDWDSVSIKTLSSSFTLGFELPDQRSVHTTTPPHLLSLHFVERWLVSVFVVFFFLFFFKPEKLPYLSVPCILSVRGFSNLGGPSLQRSGITVRPPSSPSCRSRGSQLQSRRRPQTLVCVWGCPAPTGSRPPGCPPARECHGSACGLRVAPWSCRSRWSRPGRFPCGRGWTARSCRRPADNEGAWVCGILSAFLTDTCTWEFKQCWQRLIGSILLDKLSISWGAFSRLFCTFSALAHLIICYVPALYLTINIFFSSKDLKKCLLSFFIFWKDICSKRKWNRENTIWHVKPSILAREVNLTYHNWTPVSCKSVFFFVYFS